jgi:hypothetical protein
VIRRAGLLIAGGLCLLFRPAISLGVIEATNTSDPTPTNLDTLPYSGASAYVGQYGGAVSCVYVANDWILAAAHEGAPSNTSPVVLNGVTYTATGQYTRLTNSDSSDTDMILFKISGNTGLTNLTISSNGPTVGETYFNYGVGYDRTSAVQFYDSSFNPTVVPADEMYEGYNVGSVGVPQSMGQNTVLNLGTMADPVVDTTYNIGFGNVTGFEGEFTPGTDMILNGDSGGGAFNSSGQLIGLNDADGTYTSQPGNEALYGDVSAMIDLSAYANEINSDTGVPEPSSAVLLLAGLPILMRRRSRA